MKSLDTNILLYAADEDCREHTAAIGLVNEALRSPADWLLSDQVLFELYAGLRHPRVFAKPLSAVEAARRVAFLRQESGFPIGHTPESTISLTLIRFRRSPFCATKNRARCGNLYLLSPSPSPSGRGLG